MKFKRIHEKKIIVFDLDDTLAKSSSKIILKSNGKIIKLSPAEFAKYVPKPGDEFDYSEFQHLINPKLINWTTKIFKAAIRKYQNTNNAVIILSARGSKVALIEYLQLLDIPYYPQVVALNNADPKAKAKYIEKEIIPLGYTIIETFDDALPNYTNYELLKKKYANKGITFINHLVGARSNGKTNSSH